MVISKIAFEFPIRMQIRLFLATCTCAVLISGCATMQDVANDFEWRVQIAAAFALANEHLISDHSPDQCQFAHWDWSKKSFVMIFDRSVGQDIPNFFRRIIEIKGGTVVSGGQNALEVYISLVVQERQIVATLVVVPPARREQLAANRHQFILKKPWSTFSPQQRESAFNAIVPFMVHTTCKHI